MLPKLTIVIPCYNEEAVLPITAPIFRDKLLSLTRAGKIHEDSRLLFVDDGSRDRTWEIICALATSDAHYTGIRQSRNRGHQNALLAGLMEAMDSCDVTISIDCDGQDDPDAMDAMLDEYLAGCDIVYGVRSDRRSDRPLKRFTARNFYRLLRAMGVETVYDHADYRLVSSRALHAFADFKEVNLFLRGMFPLIGFRSSTVGYTRRARLAGKSHYSLSRMVALAIDGITSLSTKPLQWIVGMGCAIAALSFIGVLWSVIVALTGNAVSGWASTTCIICFIGGIQLICIGVIGIYVGKIYMEVKHRPRYIISERTQEQ